MIGSSPRDFGLNERLALRQCQLIPARGSQLVRQELGPSLDQCLKVAAARLAERILKTERLLQPLARPPQ